MNLATYLSEQKLSQSAFAELLGVTQGLVYQWLAGRRPVAAERCVAIERATNGAVTRKDLRPDDWRDIWPELDTSSSADEKCPVEAERTE
ncbi:transcriptional regulator [Paraburkholderia sacchari]|uniref:transcriptional regulator n=1 Tax=Paraburkholderia sacchari TaxID=159450 RepID=UPI001BCC7724|nr:helix-turn-helix domain-containing protein [Paraburkholderia sacchari]